MALIDQGLIDFVIEQASKLREAGVLLLEVEGLKVQLAPAPRAPYGEEGYHDDEPPPPSNPMTDPMTYGRGDGAVPGWPKLHEPTDEDE